MLFSSGLSTLKDVFRVGTRVEKIADVEPLQIFVAVELLVVGVGDGIELRFILRHQHRLGITAEVRTGHGDDMHAVAGDELAEMNPQLVVRISRNMMELVDGNQPVIERFDAKLIDGEAEGGMGTNQ
jgi:hypothetical protein